MIHAVKRGHTEQGGGGGDSPHRAGMRFEWGGPPGEVGAGGTHRRFTFLFMLFHILNDRKGAARAGEQRVSQNARGLRCRSVLTVILIEWDF